MGCFILHEIIHQYILWKPFRSHKHPPPLISPRSTTIAPWSWFLHSFAAQGSKLILPGVPGDDFPLTRTIGAGVHSKETGVPGAGVVGASASRGVCGTTPVGVPGVCGAGIGVAGTGSRGVCGTTPVGVPGVCGAGIGVAGTGSRGVCGTTPVGVPGVCGAGIGVAGAGSRGVCGSRLGVPGVGVCGANMFGDGTFAACGPRAISFNANAGKSIKPTTSIVIPNTNPSALAKKLSNFSI